MRVSLLLVEPRRRGRRSDGGSDTQASRSIRCAVPSSHGHAAPWIQQRPRTAAPEGLPLTLRLRQPVGDRIDRTRVVAQPTMAALDFDVLGGRTLAFEATLPRHHTVAAAVDRGARHRWRVFQQQGATTATWQRRRPARKVHAIRAIAACARVAHPDRRLRSCSHLQQPRRGPRRKDAHSLASVDAAEGSFRPIAESCLDNPPLLWRLQSHFRPRNPRRAP